MTIPFVIIGGGTAGLSAAIRLTELGEQPLLIEGGSYPSHKVCGEFLSPECLPVLQKWKIHPLPISKALFKTSTRQLEFPFPLSAGGLSHFALDLALLDYAMQSGAHIRMQTRVRAFHPKQYPDEEHQIELASGEIVKAFHVIIATGRIPHPAIQTPRMVYMGFKAHFKNIATDCLEMFLCPGAYLGIAPIENQCFNVACLADLRRVQQRGTPGLFLDYLIANNRSLKARLAPGVNLFDRWMTAELPSFGMRQTPNWLDTYFIGDAALSIPPACGDGLSMAILGGCMAAEYALRSQSESFKQMWHTQCKSPLFWSKLLHRCMLHPACASPLFLLARHFPASSRKVFDLTRHP